MVDTNYSKVPVDYMVEGVRLYIEHGVPPGHFLTALFSNNLMESYKRADENNTAAMQRWVAFMYWEMPNPSQGSPERVAAWIKMGGLRGLAEAEAAAATEAEDNC